MSASATPPNPAPARRRISGTSLARLLPAVVLAFLPFGQVDDGLLGSLYALRGKREAGPRLATYSYASLEELRGVSERLRAAGKKTKCFFFLPQETGGLDACLHVIVEDFYSSDLTRQSHAAMVAYLATGSAPPAGYRPLYYGGLEQFDVAPLQARTLESSSFADGNVRALAFVPRRSDSKVRIPTPVGPLGGTEMGLNVLGNALENKTLMTAGRGVQIVVSLLTAVLAAFIIYSYPIFMTLILVLGIGASEFALSALVFDRFSLQLPLAGPLCVLIATYLLGMSDRLDRRERREWRLEQESANLKHLDEMRNNFLSLVSHDLKTPIARMQSSLERILRGDFGVLSADQQNHLQRILSANGSLQRSISTLLLLNRVETSSLHIQFQPTDLARLLEEIAQLHRPVAADRNIVLLMDFEPMFLVDLDPALIREVASNLIDNAMKYSPSGSQISLRCGELDNCPELLPPQPGVWFEVQDQGPGIEKPDRKKVFQKFVRGSNENTAIDQSIKGTGLGLFLTRFFVEQHNGSVTLIAKSAGETVHPSDPASQYFPEHGTGTVFRVVLPIEQPESVESV